MGISWRRFRGWSPRTSYVYDDAGRLVGSTVEAEWTDQEQDRMIALSEYEDSLCPKCGGPVSECTDPANEFKFKTGAPTRCHRMTSQVLAAEKASEIKHSQALMFYTEKKD